MLDQATSPSMQRAKGRGEVTFAKSGLSHLYQSGCAKILLPRSYTSVPEAVFINTSGGVTGGDQLAFKASVEENTALTITTQAAERIYRSSGGVGQIDNQVEIGAGGALDWLPQETILFDGSALNRQLTVNMAKNSTFLGVETLVFGRRAMGETLTTATLRDQWRITRGGKLTYADTFHFDDPAALAASATLNGNRALTTFVYVAPDAEDRLTQARALLPESIESAASTWNGMLVARFLAPDAYPLRTALIHFLTQFRGRDLPRIWHM